MKRNILLNIIYIISSIKIIVYLPHNRPEFANLGEFVYGPSLN